MTITRIDLVEIRLPLLTPFETSVGRTTERRIILVRVEDDREIEGWGECVAEELPLYSEEWTGSAWPALETILAPMAAGADPERIRHLFEPIRGNRMAKAAIESAAWDLRARQGGVPLWELLGGIDREIPCGVSIGLQDSTEALLANIERELAAGYQRIKIKIKPGRDLDLIAAVRDRFPDVPLMADANSAYRLSDAPLLRKLDAFKLTMIEQPLAHDDIVDHAKLQQQIETPICLDESIRHVRDAQHAIQLGACRVINIKMGRVGGHAMAREIEDLCRGKSIPVWCGGMLESGIGRAHNIALSTLPGFTLPGDVSASARYWDEDIIDPPVTVSAQGTIRPSSLPGIGYRVKRDRIDQLAVRRATID
ncbi:MAG TPA: o-succinylbenzoate synthase [Thermoanaerobaculia bacterium]|nr:o-succinylbenzoate synthase [Thermoanaerobaculia bacterium]